MKGLFQQFCHLFYYFRSWLLFRFLPILYFIQIPFYALAQSDKPIAPAFFGPNAFKVPEIHFGKTSEDFLYEFGSSLYKTRDFSLTEDFNADVFFKLTAPLFSKRVNLTIYGEAMDIYENSLEANSIRGLSVPTKGHEFGEIYIGTEIWLLSQEKNNVNITMRSVLKSAAGGSAVKRRYYDSPGYFFDLIVGKEYMISDKAFVNLAATSGFLCWQTSLCGQNDAVMYGLAANCRVNDVELKAHWGGYVGWRKENDCPMTLRADFLLHRKFCDFRLHYQKGLIDWPYSHIALSLITHFGKSFNK